MLLDLKLGVVDSGASERTLGRRDSLGEAEAVSVRTLLGKEMSGPREQAGSGGGVRDGHDSRRRHGCWTTDCKRVKGERTESVTVSETLGTKSWECGGGFGLGL